MKRDSGLLFQSLLSLAFIAFAGLIGLSLITSLRLPQQTTELPEAPGDQVVADRAEWKQFYDGSGQEAFVS